MAGFVRFGAKMAGFVRFGARMAGFCHLGAKGDSQETVVWIAGSLSWCFALTRSVRAPGRVSALCTGRLEFCCAVWMELVHVHVHVSLERFHLKQASIPLQLHVTAHCSAVIFEGLNQTSVRRADYVLRSCRRLYVLRSCRRLCML